MSAPAGFPALLLRLRADRGMTQKDLAKASGVSVPQIARYETGTSKPRMTAISKLAKALGVSPDELINANEPETVEFLGYGDDGELYQPLTMPKEVFEAVQVAAAELGVSYEVWIATVLEFQMLSDKGGSPDFSEILEKNKQHFANLPMPEGFDSTGRAK